MNQGEFDRELASLLSGIVQEMLRMNNTMVELLQKINVTMSKTKEGQESVADEINFIKKTLVSDQDGIRKMTKEILDRISKINKWIEERKNLSLKGKLDLRNKIVERLVSAIIGAVVAWVAGGFLR